MKLVIFGLIALMISSGMITQSYAHTTVEVEQYAIEAGWGIEPPVVEIRNSVVFKVTEPGDREGTYRGITNAFQNLESFQDFRNSSFSIFFLLKQLSLR